MKTANKFFAVTVAFCAITSAVFASDDVKVQSYAHPTLFGSNAQTVADTDSSYLVGGKILKSKNKLGVKNKGDLYIDACSKNLLNIVKKGQEKAGYSDGMFDIKQPILRSELAVVLAEGLNAKDSTKTSGYSDVSDNYWAKKWIYSATDAGLMIGYPSGAFKPDQRITKAEVFATIAQQINVNYDKKTPVYKGQTVKYIPEWAYNATNEVIASGLLDHVPDPDKVINAEYLSKEQVAYLVGALNKNYSYMQNLNAAKNALNTVACAKSGVTTLNIKLLDRLSAKTSNVGDAFTAKTTQQAVVNGVTFPAGSIVRGEVVEVQRPGVKQENAGYLKVQFNKIKNLETDEEQCLPKAIASADASEIKNPNFFARLLGFPLTGAGRVVGVAGRTASSAVSVAANGVEKIGDNLGDTLVETLSLHPGRGMASFGNVFATTGKGIYDIAKLAVSGTFGVIYELADEVTYVLVPSLSNSSSLNPDEELTIVF